MLNIPVETIHVSQFKIKDVDDIQLQLHCDVAMHSAQLQ